MVGDHAKDLFARPSLVQLGRQPHVLGEVEAWTVSSLIGLNGQPALRRVEEVSIFATEALHNNRKALASPATTT